MELLERHFDTALDAPDGVNKLRDLILTLAMQGKLVPQDPKDPPASELLNEIEVEKKRLVKHGKIKEPKTLPPVSTEEMPFALPKGWEWVRLGTVAEYNGRDHADPKDIDKDCWVLDLEDIEKTTSRLLYIAKYSERESKSTKSQFKMGDVLYGKLRPYLDKVLVADSDGVCTTELVPIVPSKAIAAQFLRWMLKSPSFLRYVNALMYGVKMPRLGTDDAINSIHPLPPLNEQLRMVAKIDELMARCDVFEKLRAERDTKRLAVHAAAVHQLLNVDDTNGHIQAREFLGQHFGELYTVKDNVTELRKAILQLAVMGKLVPQDPSDPPASELLKQIEDEKKRLVKAGKIRESKALPPVSTEEMPYALPKGWQWVRLGTSMLKITDGTHHSPPNGDQGDFLYISAKNIKEDGVMLSNATYVTEAVHKEIYSRCDPEPGNVLYIKDGATTGVVTINNLDEPFSMLSSVALLKQPSGINNRYLFLTLKAPFFYEAMRSGMTGVAITRVTLNKLQEAIIPLAPYNEQYRIVAKIDQLMSMCNTLEQQIDNARETQSSLLNAMMAQYEGQRCA